MDVPSISSSEPLSPFVDYENDFFTSALRVMCYVCEPLALLLNATLAFLVLTRKSQQTGASVSYRRMFLLSAVADSCYALSLMASLPRYLFVDGALVAHFIGFAASSDISYGFIGAFYFSFCFNLALVVTGFIFRYLLVVNSPRAEFFIRWPTFLLVCMFVAVTAGVFSVCPFLDVVYPEDIATHGKNLTNIPDGVNFMSYILEENALRKLTSFGAMIVIVSLCCLTMSVYGMRVHVYLRRSKLSARTKRMHQRAVLILLLEALIPVVCLCIPFVEVVGNALSLFSTPMHSCILACLPPALDPLVVVVLTNEYRPRMLMLIVSRLKRGATAARKASHPAGSTAVIVHVASTVDG